MIMTFKPTHAVLIDEHLCYDTIRDKFEDILDPEMFMVLFFESFADMRTGAMDPDSFVGWLVYDGVIDSQKNISDSQISMLANCANKMLQLWSEQFQREGLMSDDTALCRYKRRLNDGAILFELPENAD